MSNLIGISGKIGSGKDTVGKIIQILTNYPEMNTDRVMQHMNKEFANSNFQIKKFADKLKDCVCVMIGCTREQLEDQEFKNTALGQEWDFWRLKLSHHTQVGHWPEVGKLFLSLEEAHEHFTRSGKDWGSNAGTRFWKDDAFEKVQMTPRLLLQLLGTDCGRKIIHPNIWVNASFAEYQPQPLWGRESTKISQLPNWIFTDMRFPNELEAIKERSGITIRLNRTFLHNEETRPIGFKEHESETALDNADFDYVIENNNTLEDLIHTVKLILQREKIIK